MRKFYKNLHLMLRRNFLHYFYVDSIKISCMKYLYRVTPVLILLFISLTSFVANNGKTDKKGQEVKKINWVSIEEAEKLTMETPKKIFVDVYTDWCGWCKRMDATTFTDEAVIDYVNEHFYAVKLNAESKENISLKGMNTNGIELARSFRVSAYPTIVFIDETFQRVTPVPGYRKAEEFRDILKQFNEAE